MIQIVIGCLAGFLVIACPTEGQGAGAQAGSEYSSIDKLALEAPASAESSMETLAKYLTGSARSDVEKARAIYRWITDRIAYDVAAFKSGKFSDKSQSPEEVLRQRKGVCAGYSALFQRLAELGGLECVLVDGYSKGYGYKPGQNVTDSKHGWNAVKLGNRWRLIDATWGAGYVDDKDQFVKRFEESYFMASPDDMIVTHFPEEGNWQLLPRQVSLKEFEEFVYLQPGFLRRGFRLVSHKKGVIKTGADLEVTIQGNAQTLMIGSLLQNGEKLPSSYVLVQKRSDAQVQTKAVFPKAGEYMLRLFAKDKDAEGLYDSILEYTVIASSGKGERIGFSKICKSFIDSGCYLYQPLEMYLKAGSTQTFKIRVPDAVSVAVVENNEWKLLARGAAFEGPVKIAAGKIQVCAKFPGQKDYAVLLEYAGY